MKRILVLTTFNNHYRFFHRLAHPLKVLGYETNYLTNKYSILKEANLNEDEIFLIGNNNGTNLNVNVDNSFEVASGVLSKPKAEKISSIVSAHLEQLFEAQKFDYIFLWGGVRLIEMTAGVFAKLNNIRTLYFELANFPQKVFVDPRGTNAKSLLAENSDILLSLKYDVKEFRKWSENYIMKSLKQHSVPQSKSAANVEYLKNIYDVFGFQFKNLPQTEPILTKEKLVGKYLRKILKLDYDNIDLVNTKYLFFPMQVNKDAQLILNSKVGNIDALKIANKTAKEKGLKLIVKPHPGEVEFGFIKKVNTLKEKLGFAFVKNNTIELIKNAEKVVTINSTVGLQAKIAGKKVTCLGNAFYQDFDERKLAAYTQSYLIDADFWDEGKISLESAEKILNRVEIN
jgi:capsular polysaccharide export protein